ncbi:MAG: caspase family protein [Hydrogenophaga sp.]|nr:caspase family protein [Hydrogenophaga sp.]
MKFDVAKMPYPISMVWCLWIELALFWVMGTARATTVSPPIASPAAASQAYHALVIGNADYSGRARDLLNPVRDAALMAQTLRNLGFVVTQKTDMSRQDMRQAVEKFGLGLPKDSVALVYYAGHGVQVQGKNYLMPVDTPMDREQSVPLNAYALSTLLEHLSLSKSALNIVVMDACRNNPFEPEKPVRYRNWRVEGWAPVQSPRGTLIAYSTAPGELAADGSGENSLYTRTLADALKQPGLPLEVVFKRVSETVRKATKDDQIPWFESSVNEEFFFVPPHGVKVAPSGWPSGKPVAVASSRSLQSEPQWFDRLTVQEWNELDWELQQRTKHFTRDEVPLIERKAQAGNVLAMTTLGLAYRQGLDKTTGPSTQVRRSGANNTMAVRWLQRAAASGFAIAQTELGEMYYGGRGVDRDVARARSLFEAAAQTGYTRARLNLAQVSLEQGRSQEDLQRVGKDLLDALMKGMPTVPQR